MSKAGSDTSTTTSSQGPPAYLQPYLKYGAQQAQQLYQGSGPSYYPGSTVASQSPYTQAALQGTAARATNGSPLNAAAGGYLQNVLGGQYLNQGNPYQAALDQSILGPVSANVNSQFSAAGRYGSGAHAGELATAEVNALAPYQYGNYQQERANQQAAAGMAPNQAAQDYVDLGQLAAAGQQQDQYGQSLINANIDKWNYNQNLPYNKLAQYMGLLNGNNFGTTGTSTQTIPSQGFNWGGLLGGVLGGIL